MLRLFSQEEEPTENYAHALAQQGGSQSSAPSGNEVAHRQVSGSYGRGRDDLSALAEDKFSVPLDGEGCYWSMREVETRVVDRQFESFGTIPKYVTLQEV